MSSPRRVGYGVRRDAGERACVGRHGRWRRVFPAPVTAAVSLGGGAKAAVDAVILRLAPGVLLPEAAARRPRAYGDEMQRGRALLLVRRRKRAAACGATAAPSARPMAAVLLGQRGHARCACWWSRRAGGPGLRQGLQICSVQQALEGWSRHEGVLALTASACNRLGSPHSGTCPRAPRSLGISRTWDMPRSDGRRCLGALSKTPCSHSPLLASACRGAPVRCAPAGQPVLQDWPPLASQLTIGAPRFHSAAWLLVSFTQPHCWLWACGG